MTDPVDILRELNPVSELPPPAIEPLWERLADDGPASAARARGPRRLRRRRPSFAGALTAAGVLAATALAVLIVGTIQHRSTTAPKSVPLGAPLPVPLTPSRFGVTLPSTVRLLTSVPDIERGLPWGLRAFRTNRGSLCLQAGRLRDGQLGRLGARGAFRAMAASPVLDAHCGRASDTSIAAIERIGGRIVYFGVVPAGGLDVDYRYAHGRGEFAVGILLLPPFVHRPEPYLQLPTGTVVSPARLSSASATLHLTVGAPCALHRVTSGTFAGACRVVIPRALVVTRAQVATPIHVRLARAATFCSPRSAPEKLAPCPANLPAGDHITGGAGRVLVTLSFRTRVAPGRGYFGWTIALPKSGPGCSMESASASPLPGVSRVARIQTLEPLCSGRYSGTVTFTPSNGQVQGTAVLVGHYSFDLRP